MKKLIISLLAFSTISTSTMVSAEWKNKLHNKDKQQKIERIATELNLTSAQKEQMKELQVYYNDRLRSLKESKLDKATKQQEKTRLINERKQKIQSILTEEQLEKAEEMKYAHLSGDKRKRNKSKKDFNSLSPEQRAEKMTSKMDKMLNLSDEQEEQITDINLKYANELQELKSKAVTKDEIRDIRERQREELSEVLTDNQLSKLDDLESKRQNRRNRGHGEKTRSSKNTRR